MSGITSIGVLTFWECLEAASLGAFSMSVIFHLAFNCSDISAAMCIVCNQSVPCDFTLSA